MKGAKEYILTLSCHDAMGIAHAVSGLLYPAGCSIVDSQQFGDVADDAAAGRFFMPVQFTAPSQLAAPATLEALFGDVRKQFDMALRLHARDARPRLAIDVPCVVSNHTTHAELLLNGHKTVVFR